MMPGSSSTVPTLGKSHHVRSDEAVLAWHAYDELAHVAEAAII